MSTERTPDQVRALEIARELIRHGVPVFAARPALDQDGNWDPDGGTTAGYWLPQGWEKTYPTEKVLDGSAHAWTGRQWEPGMALCAVMGHTLDLVDVDPRNGGDEGIATLPLPILTGHQTTPSGGYHEFIAPLGIQSKDKVAPGVDVKSGTPDGRGRGFAFIAPTVKRSKVTGEPGVYAWVTPPDFSAISGDLSGSALREVIVAARAPRHPEYVSGDSAEDDAGDDEVMIRVRAHIAALERAEVGERNSLATSIAAKCGQYVGAGQLDRELVRDLLAGAVAEWNRPDLHLKTIEHQLDWGIAHPDAWKASAEIPQMEDFSELADDGGEFDCAGAGDTVDTVAESVVLPAQTVEENERRAARAVERREEINAEAARLRRAANDYADDRAAFWVSDVEARGLPVDRAAANAVRKAAYKHYLEQAQTTDLRARTADDTKRALARERAGLMPPPCLTELTELLAEPDTEEQWRIRDLWLSGGNNLLVAQYKAGKTTMLGNVVRSLVDGDTFLGTPGELGSPFDECGGGHAVTQLLEGERVGLLDLELDRATLRRWLRDQRIQATGAVYAESLRGRVGEFDITDDDRRLMWAEKLTSLGIAVLIIDPLAPLLSAMGIEENDNTGVGTVLNLLDQLKAEAGIREMLVTHHMGNDHERARGASRLKDWPDATWKLVREGEAGSEPPPDAARFFSAFGRDVAQTEARLSYEPESRRYVISGGNRTSHAVTKHAPAVSKIVAQFPGIVTRELEMKLKIEGVGQKEARIAYKAAQDMGEVHTHAGARRAQEFHVSDRCDSCPVDD